MAVAQTSDNDTEMKLVSVCVDNGDATFVCIKYGKIKKVMNYNFEIKFHHCRPIVDKPQGECYLVDGSNGSKQPPFDEVPSDYDKLKNAYDHLKTQYTLKGIIITHPDWVNYQDAAGRDWIFSGRFRFALPYTADRRIPCRTLRKQKSTANIFGSETQRKMYWQKNK